MSGRHVQTSSPSSLPRNVTIGAAEGFCDNSSQAARLTVSVLMACRRSGLYGTITGPGPGTGVIGPTGSGGGVPGGHALKRRLPGTFEYIPGASGPMDHPHGQFAGLRGSVGQSGSPGFDLNATPLGLQVPVAGSEADPHPYINFAHTGGVIVTAGAYPGDGPSGIVAMNAAVSNANI